MAEGQLASDVHVWICPDDGDPVAEVLGRYSDGDVRWSKSDSRGVALVAVTAGRAVGVDLEYERDVKHARRIGERLLGGAPRDRADFFRRWTTHEALVKATRGRLLEPTPDAAGFTIHELDAPEGYTATLVVEGDARPVLYRM